MIWLQLIAFLFVASVWLAIVGIGASLCWGVWSLYCWWRARRNDAQVPAHLALARGIRAAWRRGLFTDGDQ